jgi:Zn-finger nucleic acid-binding protein
MKCPKCQAEMKKIEFAGVEVDRCTGCYGIWFDFQEQQQLKAKRDAVSIDSGDRAMGKKMNLVDTINCPRDGVRLTRLVDVKQPHLWYEACPHCYGVFFDAGEFKDYSRRTLLESIRDLFPRERD